MQTEHKKNIKIVRKYHTILGIKVISAEITEVLTAVKEKITHNVKFYITTPNPELVLMAQKNEQLQNAINSSDFAIPDGIGLAQAAKYLSLPAPKNKILRFLVCFYQGILVGGATLINKKWLTDELNIIKGRELFEELIKLAAEKHWRVFLLGGINDEARLAAEKLKVGNSLKTENWKLKINFHSGPRLTENADPVSQVDIKLQSDAIAQINNFNPHLLFVAFGNPKQELWIYKQSLPLCGKNVKKLNVNCIMAVGGTFRYISGLSKLPPKWLASLGLEWVWRLITEPFRFKRIFNAFPLFPMKILWSKVLQFSGHESRKRK